MSGCNPLLSVQKAEGIWSTFLGSLWSCLTVKDYSTVQSTFDCRFEQESLGTCSPRARPHGEEQIYLVPCKLEPYCTSREILRRFYSHRGSSGCSLLGAHLQKETAGLGHKPTTVGGAIDAHRDLKQGTSPLQASLARF